MRTVSDESHYVVESAHVYMKPSYTLQGETYIDTTVHLTSYLLYVYYRSDNDWRIQAQLDNCLSRAYLFRSG